MFGFGKRRKSERATASDVADEIMNTKHKGEILDACSSDVERRSLCLQWAGELRTKWYDGQRIQAAYVVKSDNPRYRHYSTEVRKKVGEQQWGASKVAKDLAATEQMYSRWAVQYAGGIER